MLTINTKDIFSLAIKITKIERKYANITQLFVYFPTNLPRCIE